MFFFTILIALSRFLLFDSAWSSRFIWLNQKLFFSVIYMVWSLILVDVNILMFSVAVLIFFTLFRLKTSLFPCFFFTFSSSAGEPQEKSFTFWRLERDGMCARFIDDFIYYFEVSIMCIVPKMRENNSCRAYRDLVIGQ